MKSRSLLYLPYGQLAGDLQISESRLSRIEQGEQTRLNILIEAGKLFARDGYSGVSIRTIAEACGTTKALLFHHFGSKEALYKAVHARFQEMYMDALSSVEPEDEKEAELEFLFRLLRARIRFYSEHPEVARMVLWGHLESSPMQPPSPEPFREELINKITSAQERGELNKSLDIATLMKIISGALFFFFSSNSQGDESSSEQAEFFIGQLERLLWNGVH